MTATNGAWRALAASVVAFLGCGGGWVDADTRAATDSARVQLMIESLCAIDAACSPAQVRAMDRVSYCGSASMLFRHGQAVPGADGGIACLPQ